MNLRLWPDPLGGWGVPLWYAPMPVGNFPITRREMLCRSGMGMGALGLANLLASDGQLSATPHGANLSPLAPRQPHFPARAKRFIHLFMNGAPAPVDTFHPQPALPRYAVPLA